MWPATASDSVKGGGGEGSGEGVWGEGEVCGGGEGRAVDGLAFVSNRSG